MAKKRVDVEIGVRNRIANGLKTVTASIRNFARGASRMLSSVGLSFKRLAAIGIGSFAALIRHGNSFRASMAEVKTMLGDDKTMLPELTKQVRELSSEFGLAKKTLAEGLYQALSAGVPANNAIDFLRVASKSAVGGVTDVKTAVDGLTSVLNAYAIDAAKVAQVSDIMFSVVKEGKINFEELSQNIGNIAPFAKVAGVGIEDLSAMIATLVKVDKPERAMTSLRQAMVFAAQSGKPLMQMLEEFEGKSLEDMLAAGVTQKSAAGIAIMSGNMKVLREQMDLFSNTAGAANAAFEDVSAVRGWQRLWQSVLAVVSDVGERIDVVVQPAITRLTSSVKKLIADGTIDVWANKAAESVVSLGSALSKLVSIMQTVISLAFAAMWAALASAIGFAVVKTTLYVQSVGGLTAALFPLMNALIRLKMIMIAIAGAGVALNAAFLAGIAGAVGFARAVWQSHMATLALIKSQKDLKAIEQKSMETYGTRNASTLRKIRQTMQGGTDKEKETVERLFPEAAAAWKGKSKTDTGAPEKIGLGSMGPMVKPGGIGKDTSMMSTGDLFTMMQAGSGAQRESELSELQEINQGIQDLIEASGGVE